MVERSEAERDAPRAKISKANLGLVVLAVLATLIGLELGLRGFQYVRHGTPVFSFLPGYRDARFQLSPFLVFGPRIDWQLPGKRIPELARFNSQGFRLSEPVPAKEPGEFRIIALGGSTTEDVWNDAGIHWPLVAQCSLRRQGFPVRILNGAMSAFTTAHSLVRLQFDVLEYEPDMVVVMDAVNDLTVNYVAAAKGKPVDPNYLVKYGDRGYTGDVDASDVVLSRLARLLRGRMRSGRDPVIPREEWSYDLEVGAQFFARNLRHIGATAVRSDVEAVLITMPYSRDPLNYADVLERRAPDQPGLGMLPAQDRFMSDMDRYNAVIRSVAAEQGMGLVDMAALLRAGPADFVDPVHKSTAGILNFGTTFASALMPQLKSRAATRPLPMLRECELLESHFPA